MAGRVSAARAKTVRAWEDDPLSGSTPIERPVPKFPRGRLKLAIDVAQPAPGPYQPGTPEFRYWTAADALVRAVAFWSPVLPRGTTWQRGAELAVRLDAGDKLNAFYNRETLTFFHATVQAQTVYSGESPDVLTHELGHGILDAVRPQLWDAMSHEVAAFHESFGDISALLTALQVPSLRVEVLAETGGVLNRSSRLSRVAEQLGWAIRQRQPCAVDADCLRNAVNCFFYQPPEQLPVLGPAVVLSSEPHSYSRVFTGAFFVALTGMVLTLSRQPDPDVLQQASVDAGRLIISAVRAAPIVPAYLSQVAAHMLAADQELFGGKYADALQNGFAGKGLLSTSGMTGWAPTADALALATPAARDSELPTVTLNGLDFGLGDRPVLCQAAGEGRRLAVSAVGNDGGPAASASPEDTARGFLRELVVRDKVTLPGREPADDRLHTHEVVESAGALRVVRRLVDAAIPWSGGQGGSGEQEGA